MPQVTDLPAEVVSKYNAAKIPKPELPPMFPNPDAPPSVIDVMLKLDTVPDDHINTTTVFPGVQFAGSTLPADPE
jgi:hypothetical protein